MSKLWIKAEIRATKGEKLCQQSTVSVNRLNRQHQHMNNATYTFLCAHTHSDTPQWHTTVTIRESHAVILRDRVVPASQVPFPGEPSGEPGNGTWRAGTTLYRRNDSVGFFFSPVTIKLLQRIRTKTSFDQFCIRFIQIYHLLWSSARVRNKLLTNHRRDVKTQGEGRWTRQGWIYLMFDVIRHIFTIPLHVQNQRNSKGEKHSIYDHTHPAPWLP